MQIYFAGSIRAGRGDADVYCEILNLLRKHGSILTEHVAYGVGPEEATMTEAEIFEKAVDKLDQCHSLVAEVTNPSLGVGFEIAYCQQKKKPILCLYRKGSEKPLSAMIRGNVALQVSDYESLDDVAAACAKFFANIST